MPPAVYKDNAQDVKTNISEMDDHFQSCPYCNNPMGAIRGSVDAICKKCGYKEPCCF